MPSFSSVMPFSTSSSGPWHGTTIVCVRDNHQVAMAGDGQVSMGNTVMKHTARKIKRLGTDVLAGFAGSTADAFTLLEYLEKKIETYPGQLKRSCLSLAKEWRSDKYLRKLEAMMIVADSHHTFVLTGVGDVLQPEERVCAIGSGGNYALAAGIALCRAVDRDEGKASPQNIALRALEVAADICVFTNSRHTLEVLNLTLPTTKD